MKLIGFTLKKIRELKGVSRKQVGVMLGLNYKTIEKYENGRASISESKLQQFLKIYGLSYEEFCNCRDGKLNNLINAATQRRPKIIEQNSLRRSYKRIISKETKALKSLRILKGLSQYKASIACGYSKSAIGHIENGRIELSRKRICHIVDSYGYTIEDFNRHLNSETPYSEIQNECIEILKSLSEKKLKAVHPLLSTFKN